MKTNFIKSRNKIISILLCIMLFLSCILFSSCSFEEEVEGQVKGLYNQYIDGFKVVYSESLTGDKAKIEDHTEELVRLSISEGLLYYYGYGDESIDLSKKFPDSIRMLVYGEEREAEEGIEYYAKVDEGYKWNWSLNDNLTGAPKSFFQPSENEAEIYRDWKVRALSRFMDFEKAAYNFLDIYTTPLQMVLYEIMLGYELSTFNVSYGETATIVEVKTCPSDASLNGANVTERKIKEYIDERLLEKYQEVTKYTGFTKDNADRLITYILDEVIGKTLVSYDYTKYVSTDYYRNYVKTVAEIIYNQTYDESKKYEYSYDIYNYDSNGRPTTKVTTITYDFVKANDGGVVGEGNLSVKKFSPKAATFLQNFEGESFFEEFSGGADGEKDYNYPSNSPKAEYQSIVIVTNPDKVFGIEWVLGFNILAYNKDLTINLKARYYDYESRTIFEFVSNPISFDDARELYDTDENKTAYETDFEAPFDVSVLPDAAKGFSDDGSPMFIVPSIENDKYVDLGKEKEINLGDEDAKFYKVAESQNGYGGTTIVNEREMECSFYEIVFDVVKNPDDPVGVEDFYTFKVSISLVL